MAINIRERVLLAPLTTFNIGGPAKFFAEVRTDEEVREAMNWANNKGVPPVMLAGGSNVLIPDEGIQALVIHLLSDNVAFSGRELNADAGSNLSRIIRAASEKSLGGWEKLSGIPGTIGGAVRGNAGAFGTEIKDWVANVHSINSRTGEFREFKNNECDFSYRHSHFKDNGHWIILKVKVSLKRADPESSFRLIKETIAERERRHLQDVRAAGSFFMNPVVPRELQELFEKEKGERARGGRVPAGWLIEKVGMKGAKEGGAAASLQHPNYLVNASGATAKDVRELAEKIKQAVMDKFTVLLEEEAVDMRDIM